MMLGTRASSYIRLQRLCHSRHTVQTMCRTNRVCGSGKLVPGSGKLQGKLQAKLRSIRTCACGPAAKHTQPTTEPAAKQATERIPPFPFDTTIDRTTDRIVTHQSDPPYPSVSLRIPERRSVSSTGQRTNNTRIEGINQLNQAGYSVYACTHITGLLKMTIPTDSNYTQCLCAQTLSAATALHPSTSANRQSDDLTK